MYAAESLIAESLWLRAAAGLVLGAIAGSFAATIFVRWPERRSVMRGRSRCDMCHAPLGARDLVPIVSFFAARGMCRRCGAAIDPRHIVVELAAAALGMLALVAHGGWLGLVGALLGWWLLLIALLDLQYQWLPDRLTLPLVPLGLAAAWAGLGPPLLDAAIGAAAGYTVLWLIAFLYRRLRGREGMGGGDPKLFAAIGAFLGWQQLPLVMVGAGLLGLFALLLMRARGKAVSRLDRLPLGTLMAIAAWPVWLIAQG
ncbi:MAG: prepilin peptidase [Allosphingosinicella sp.]|uniref:prepilin peptidase n=1 Tax=Allosphingosinicella sp. TaxID=2823234 RepID=UPI00394897C4